jgi:hypothetical protein
VKVNRNYVHFHVLFQHLIEENEEQNEGPDRKKFYPGSGLIPY